MRNLSLECTKVNLLILNNFVPVKNSSASNGEGHHDNQVGEEGKGAEDKVSPLPESSLDHLKEKSSKLVKTIMNLGFVNMDIYYI